MKRWLAVVCAAALLLVLMPAAGVFADNPADDPYPYDDFACGDVNWDGGVDSTDARLVLQFEVGLIDLEDIQQIAADVNGDEKVDSTDARMILQYEVGLLDGFPDAAIPEEPKEPEEPVDPGAEPPALRHAVPPTAEGALLGAVEVAIKENPDTFCNPINISYQYQNDGSDPYNSRESADPALIMYKGEYFLFASHGTGYWWSSNMRDWNFVYINAATSGLTEIDKFAPAPCVVGDTMYLTHSGGGAIFKSDNPKSGKWTRVSKPVGWSDPCMFVDDDGKVYCYYGCSPNDPIFGVELDPDNDMAKVNEIVELYQSHRGKNGFEVNGDYNNNPSGECWLEGPWMTKHEGKYYLQFAVPGTADAAYNNGCVVSDSPLGPFTLCDNSPISYKATGFSKGFGHGATMRDPYGNYWKIDTVALSTNTGFERRLVIAPVMFDEENEEMYTNTVRADYPMYIPEVLEGGFDTPGPDWHLVSYNPAAVTASSDLNAPKSNGGAKGKAAAFDEDMRTWWSAATGDAGEWIQADFGKLMSVNAIQLNFADQDATGKNNLRNNTWVTRYLMEFSQDGETWYTLVDKSDAVAEANRAQDFTHDYFELAKRIGVRYIRVTNKGPVPAGGKFAISGIRLFGNGGGTAPAKLDAFTLTRPVTDERTAVLSWTAVPDAQGYIVRYGSREGAQYIHHQVIGGTNVTVRNLIMGVDYWFTVDTYNDSGYTVGTVTKKVEATVEPPLHPEEIGPDPANFKDTELYPVYEAEDATVNAAGVRGDATASGKKSVGNMHSAGAYIEFKNVQGGSGGNGTLWLVYCGGEPNSKLTISVNGTVVANAVPVPKTGEWSDVVFQGMEIPVTGLTAGATNTIRVTGGSGGVNVDFIQVVYG